MCCAAPSTHRTQVPRRPAARGRPGKSRQVDAQLGVRSAECARSNGWVGEGGPRLISPDRVRCSREHGAVGQVDEGGLRAVCGALLLHDVPGPRGRRSERRQRSCAFHLAPRPLLLRRPFGASERSENSLPLEPKVGGDRFVVSDLLVEVREDDPEPTGVGRQRRARRRFGHGAHRAALPRPLTADPASTGGTVPATTGGSAVCAARSEDTQRVARRRRATPPALARGRLESIA
jgi:hypothetical protein